MNSFVSDFQDFAPQINCKKKVVEKSETVNELMNKIRQWSNETSPVKIINIQTIEHWAYCRFAIDSPGVNIQIFKFINFCKYCCRS